MVKRIVKIFMYLIGFLWIVSAGALDSPTWTPLIVNIICTAILWFYAYLNNWFRDYKYKED